MPSCPCLWAPGPRPKVLGRLQHFIDVSHEVPALPPFKRSFCPLHVQLSFSDELETPSPEDRWQQPTLRTQYQRDFWPLQSGLRLSRHQMGRGERVSPGVQGPPWLLLQRAFHVGRGPVNQRWVLPTEGSTGPRGCVTLSSPCRMGGNPASLDSPS